MSNKGASEAPHRQVGASPYGCTHFFVLDACRSLCRATLSILRFRMSLVFRDNRGTRVPPSLLRAWKPWWAQRNGHKCGTRPPVPEEAGADRPRATDKDHRGAFATLPGQVPFATPRIREAPLGWCPQPPLSSRDRLAVASGTRHRSSKPDELLCLMTCSGS